MGKEGVYGKAASPFGFEQLEVYKAAREFRKRVFRLAKLLPAADKFGLTAQMRDAALSITNNIAEGHGRFNWQDNSRFCRIARGSLCEVVDDINTCVDEEYAKPEHAANLKADAAGVLRLLNGYLAYLQTRQKEKSFGEHRPLPPSEPAC
jgi:four helix bundle protein